MKTLDDYFNGRDNNFNLVRFLAATAVIYAHSYPITLGRQHHDPFHALLGEGIGATAVHIFFILSGFLVTRSLLHRPSVGEFTWARFLRIYPGLFAACAFCALVVGPLFTVLPKAEYLTRPEPYEFIAINGFSLAGNLRYSLPGVFGDLPYAHGINGSLWTLPWELRMYVSLTLLGMLGIAKRPRWFSVLALIGIVAFLVNEHFLFSSSDFVRKTLRFTTFFYGGGMLFVERKRIPFHPAVAWGLIAAVVVARGFFGLGGIFGILFPLSLIYLVLYVSLVPGGWIRGFNRIGDYSYGIYVYAFPVQQMVAHFFPGLGVYGAAGASFLGTLPLAVGSWYLIEKPMMSFKSRWPLIRRSNEQGR